MYDLLKSLVSAILTQHDQSVRQIYIQDILRAAHTLQSTCCIISFKKLSRVKIKQGEGEVSQEGALLEQNLGKTGREEIAT